ncbi:uncharacterized protein CG7065 [Episyrphus balteatus]|uniref:uncharacterized protein CG7065 n=1 Tax=Episyrphus balteatus TaxID=286459 RepID=UPI0024857936|nr:uncharacterized protein CG7065 [Episyrphus balteatus]
MNIIPGEPVPPGFEDEVNRTAEIQATIKTYRDNALIGVEYTVELLNDDEREPSYICLLCDKRGDPRTIIAHWISYNHRLKYLEKHFPTAVRELAPIRYKPDSRPTTAQLIAGICDAIEHHYGRLSCTVYHADDFRSIRDRITEEINGKYHYDEKTGPSFINAIDRELLSKNSQILQITIKTPASINADVASQKERDDLDEISSDEDTQRKGSGPSSAKKKRRSQSPAYKVLPRVRRSPPFEEERSSDNKKNSNNSGNTLPTPKELSMQAFQIAQERYKWEKYRCMLEIAVKGLEKSLKDYEKNPEKHPLYPEEWKKFWNRRYKELQAEKKVDPNKYDYKPEWIVFWTKRMKELHAEEVEQKKKQIKVNLGLKEDAEEKTDQLKQKFKVQPNAQKNPGRSSVEKSTKSYSNPSAPERHPRKESSHSSKPLAVIDISDDDDDDRRRPTSRSRSKRNRPRSRSRSLSPLSDDYREPERRHGSSSYRSLYERSRGAPRPPHPSHYPPSRSAASEYYDRYHSGHFPPPPGYGPGYRVLDPYMYPQYEKQGRFSPPPPKGKSKVVEEIKEEPEDDGPLTVVAVLRLLTALEEHLGSLGPKVVDLLGKALALEKVKANSSDDMLVNEDNSVFFETIKEKLKGLLIADVLEDSQKVRAVKKAVKNIAAIIHQVNEKGKSDDTAKDELTDETKPAEEKPKLPKTTKPTIADLPFDRQILSTKLAAALVMQGREDVSTTDMDKLIYFFILLVKLSKEKVKIDGKPIQMKNVLPELGIAPIISPALVEEIIEQEVATMAAAEVEMEVEASEKEANISSSANALESLTDSDLQTLLQNFKHLSTEEQHHLIAHLKKLETADPVRVEKLRKYVNLDTDAKEPSASTSAASDYKFSDSSRLEKSVGDDSPRSTRRDHYTDDEASRGSHVRKFIDDDDDEDDDYNFEDVFKAASSNITRNSDERSQQSSSNRHGASPPPPPPSSKHHSNHRQRSLERSIDSPSKSKTSKNVDKSNVDFKKALSGAGVSLSDTQNLIANLMGSLQQSCGKFSNSKHGESVSESEDKDGTPPPRNSQQTSQPSASVPFYQQQQQQEHLQHPQMQQQQMHPQQQMFPNYQNQQMPNQGQYYPPPQMGYNNAIAYPNFNYPGQMQPTQQLAPFNANFMNQQIPGQANYNWNGGGGYK